MRELRVVLHIINVVLGFYHNLVHHSLLWFIYIDGDGLGYGAGFRFQTQWLHCTMHNISHYTDLDSDPYSLFLHETGIPVRV